MTDPIVPTGDPWKLRHLEGLNWPREDERWLVEAIRLATEATSRWGSDGVLSSGVVSILSGIRELLNAQHGDRIDMGTIDRALVMLAARCGYCLDHEREDDECVREIRS